MWPHSFLQISLVTVLTLFETLAVRSTLTLSIWLFFIGSVSAVGGIILIRTGLMRHPDDFDPNPLFQKFMNALKKWELLRGRQYICVGFVFITVSLLYSPGILLIQAWNSNFVGFVPWIVYMLVTVLLTFMVATQPHRIREHREAKKAMYASTDMVVSGGVARYNKNTKGDDEKLSNVDLVRHQTFQTNSHIQTPNQRWVVETIIGLNIVLFIVLKWMLQKTKTT